MLVRRKVGATPEQFRFAAAGLDESQVVSGNGLNTTVRQGMSVVLDGALVCARNLSEMLEDLLTYSSAVNARLAIDLAEEDLAVVLKEYCDQRRPGVTANLRELAFTAAPSPPRGRCDRQRLLQILDQLLDNAVKFTSGGSHLKLHADTVERPRNIAGEPVDSLWGAFPFTAAFNVAGTPATSIPCGFAGSLPVGFCVAFMLIFVAEVHLAAALLLSLYPIADATLTLLRRIVAGEQFLSAHKTHFYQRGVAQGLRVPQVTARVFLLGLFLACLAVITMIAKSLPVDIFCVVLGLLATALALFALARGR